MNTERAPLFADEGDLDLTGFAPKGQGAPAARPEQVRAVSEGAAFRSREPHAEPAKRTPRRYRTGRNVQLNLKVRQEAADAFYALADRFGWVLGEAFERAIAALEREAATK
jgi:hypothetical protein